MLTIEADDLACYKAMQHLLKRIILPGMIYPALCYRTLLFLSPSSQLSGDSGSGSRYTLIRLSQSNWVLSPSNKTIVLYNWFSMSRNNLLWLVHWISATLLYSEQWYYILSSCTHISWLCYVLSYNFEQPFLACMYWELSFFWTITPLPLSLLRTWHDWYRVLTAYTYIRFIQQHSNVTQL